MNTDFENNDEGTGEDYLLNHIRQQTGKKPDNSNPIDNTPVIDSSLEKLSFQPFDVKHFPCGMYYKPGTMIHVRPAKTSEIQAYSMVDDTNPYDITLKMNDMLSSCVRIFFPDGKKGTYLDIFDQDRMFLIFLIREYTFQSGNNLALDIKCTECKHEDKVDMLRKNFEFFGINPKIKPYFNENTRTFIFDTVSDTIEIAPPTIGLQKAFTDYIVRETASNREPNISFVKIIPYLLCGRTSITEEGIDAKVEEFQKMDLNTFQFLNQVVDMMTIGIEKVSKNCKNCGSGVHTDFRFPNGASGIFVVHDAFDRFIKK